MGGVFEGKNFSLNVQGWKKILPAIPQEKLQEAAASFSAQKLRLAPITGRVDDMIIIKGVNIFPSQVEHSLLKIPGVLPEYQIFVTDSHGVKGLYVKVEAESGVTGHTVCRQLREDLGFAPEGDVGPPGSLPRTEGKAKRVFYLADGEKVP